MGQSGRDSKKLCPTVNVEKGLAIYGSGVSNCDSELEKWLSDNHIV